MVSSKQELVHILKGDPFSLIALFDFTEALSICFTLSSITVKLLCRNKTSLKNKWKLESESHAVHSFVDAVACHPMSLYI